MKLIHSLILFLIGSTLSLAQSNSNVLQLDSLHQVVFLDSADASQSIIQDNYEDFFGRMSILDMQIQSKKAVSENQALDYYKAYLQSDVADFSTVEHELLSGIFTEAFESIKELNLKLFPKRIRLIKTKAKHYGPSVYYTREDMIVIPVNELRVDNRASLLNVMYHEIFHIISRYNAELRDDLYGLIGFERVNSEIIIPDAVQQRILTNPDGTSQDHIIRLTLNDGRKIMALPLIVSNKKEFNPQMQAFFAYLKFDLYEVAKDSKGSYKLIADSEGLSTIQMPSIKDFFSQIRDNTNYIIHPDEIMADNFMLWLKSKSAGQSKFSQAGQELQNQVEKVLKEFKSK